MNAARKTLRGGVYARQSHASKRSVDEQIAECSRDLKAEGGEVVDVYQDLISASRYARKKRDDWPRLLEDVGAGRLDVVSLWESSRGDRTLESWAGFLELCRDRGVLIRIADDGETYDVRKPKHWKRLATDGVSNAAYSDETRQRLLRDMRASAEAGRPHGPTPYGYTRKYDPKTREFIAQEPDPSAAKVVREIFRRVAGGEPVKSLALELAARDGIPAPGQWRAGGKPWTARSVREIVRRKAYVGLRSHNGDPETHEGVWDALIDESLFWQANRVLDDRAGRYWRSSRAEHVLTGIPVCAECGGVYGGWQDAKVGQRYGCRANGCGYVDGAELEDVVLAYVLGRLARKDVYLKLRRAGENADKELAAARAAADKLRARLDEWRDSAVRGETTPATMAKIERDLTAQIEAAERKATRAGIPPGVRDLLDAGDELPQRWADMPLAARRDVVAALVDVVIVKGRRGVRVPVKDRVSIGWKGAS